MKRESWHRSKKICQYSLGRHIRRDTNISLCSKRYPPKERSSVATRMGDQGRFAGSKILPRVEYPTNNKGKRHAGDESEPKSFGLAYSS